MRKSKKRDAHAQRIKRNAAKKAKRARLQKEFEQGVFQVSRRKAVAARRFRAARVGEVPSTVALLSLGRPHLLLRPR